MSFTEPQDNSSPSPAEVLEEERRRLSRALRTGVAENPDQLAADRREAARRNMSVETYRTARTSGQPLPVPGWDRLPEQNPALSYYLSDPANAAVAHDDTENMSTVENVLRGIGGRVFGITGGLGRASLTVPQGEGAIRIAEAFHERVRLPFHYRTEIDERGIRLVRVEGPVNVREEVMRPVRQLENTTLGYEPGTTWDEVKASPLSNFIPYALETGLVSTPDMALAVANLPVYVAARTGEIGQTRAENDRRQDATVEDLLAALPPAAASAMLERIGTRGIIGLDDAVKGGARGILPAAARAGGKEAVTEALQGTIEYAGETVGTETPFNPATAADQALAGAVAGGTFGGAVRTATATGEVALSRAQQYRMAAEMGEAGAQQLEQLRAAGETSKLRERDPNAFQAFVDHAAQGGDVEHVFIDAQAFAQSFNAEGGTVTLNEIIEAVPSVAEQLPNALATGGDIRLTVGEFAAHIANTDVGPALIEHARTDPYALSRAQAAEIKETEVEDIQAEVEQAVEAGLSREEQRASAAAVETRIAEELDKVGRFTSSVNRAYAAVLGPFYEQLGQRLGISAEQAADRYGLKFSSELPGGDRRVLEQDGELDLVHFGRAAGMTATDPARWGENAEFTPREERERRSAGAPGRTYFGLADLYRKERALDRTSPFEYRARVAAREIYDFAADPQGLRPEGPLDAANASAYEAAIQAAGFRGYRSPEFGGTVAMFDSVPVEPVGAIRTEEDAQRVADRVRELAQAWAIDAIQAGTPNAPRPDFQAQAMAELFPTQDQVFAQSATVREGRETLKKYGLDPNGRYSTREVAAALEARQRAKYGSIPASDRSPEAAKRIARWMAEEVMFEMQNPEQSGVGWYSSKFQAALDVFAQEFPELATDKDARDTFTALIAITSDGQKVVPNFQQAAGIYRTFKETGQFTADRGTARQGSVDQNLEKVQELYDAMGPAGMREFLLEEMTVSELKKKAGLAGIAFSTGYKADVKLPMAAVVFGPKLGAFYANLMGADGYLTMDRWWSRTFNRYRGTLLQKPTEQGLNRFRALIGQPDLSDDETLAATVEPRKAYERRGFKDGNEIEKAANTLYKAAFENLEDQPFNASDRSFMLQAVGEARKALKRRGVDISVADIQAVLWYYEKRLYGELGARQSADVSYEDAAQRVVAERADAAGSVGPDLGTGFEAAAEQADPGAQAFNQGPVEPRLIGAPKANEPSPAAREAAREYMSQSGLPYNPPVTYEKVDPVRAKAIAQAFEEMEHAPEDPLVKAAYQAMIDETLAQWKTIKATGLKVEFIRGEDPYAASPRMAISDVIENNHLWVYPTDAGFGSSDMDVSDNPLLAKTGEVVDGHEMLVNDVFRIVHDYFGHIKDGNGFRADGEENAWRSHAAMYSPMARRAMTTETRGQNSWVNFGPYGETNRTASAAETRYADQKIGLLPEWVSETEPAVFNQADPFYSALERAVETSQTKAAPAAQWKATLAKAAGVKKEEIQWSGINEWLDLQEGQVQREAVLAFLREGGVKVEEVVLSGEGGNGPYWVAEEEDGSFSVMDADDGVFEHGFSTFERATEAMPPATAAQFSSYKLPGADDTYREILITLPGIEGPSTHWDQPNVVAHARITERTDASGAKVLFLEEVQSDWHQKGREEGYAQQGTPEQIEAARQKLADVSDVRRGEDAKLVETALGMLDRVAQDATSPGQGTAAARDAADIRDRDNRNPASAAIYAANALRGNLYLEYRTAEEVEIFEAYKRSGLAVQEARLALDALQGQGIPDAPFRNTWQQLVMKRMIRYAVDNGFDKVAWINGNQQNGGQTGGDSAWFYERNLVNDVNKLIKGYGGKVEKIDMLASPEARTTVDRMTEEREAASRATGQDESASFQAAIENLTRAPNMLGIQNGFEITPQLAEAARSGFALFQQNRGQIAFGQDITQSPSVISLLRTADLSTFLHETGHFFLEVTTHAASQPNAPPELLADTAAILRWFDPNLTLAGWNSMSTEQKRPYHEQWARGFEAYLFEGKAPSAGLRDVFRRFSAWLKSVYKSLTALDVELTDEVRSVMDRMLASEQEVQATEQARAFRPLFETKPDTMTQGEWEFIQRLGTDATVEAIEQLQTRSARDMKWASGAKDRYVREMQREAEEQRKAIKAEVTAEVMAEPVNRARTYLRRGVGEDGQPVEGAAKLDLGVLQTQYGADGEWTQLRRGGKYGEVANEGHHPDIVAAMFGFLSGDALIHNMVTAENPTDKINGLTDQRMLERYGDLSDPKSIERAANEAVANEARAKFVAAEAAAAAKAVGKRAPLKEAARQHAAKVVNRLPLKRLRPSQYLAAQARAAVQAEKALAKDDIVGVATAKRNQLINLETARAVQKAQKEVEKAMRLFTRIASAKDDAISRTRDMELVNTARAILSLYGFGRAKNDPTGYMEAVKRYDPTLYADLAPFINGLRGEAQPLPEITYEHFQALNDTVRQLWHLSRRSKQIEIDGQLMDRQAVVGELNAQIEEIGLPANPPGQARAITDKEARGFDLLGVRAALRRVESWARGMDKGDRGPFRRYIWNPISEASDRYRAEGAVYVKRFRALLDTVKDELKPRDIAAPEIGYTFGGKSELYHALLHTGNGSNKSKLLLGRRWGKRLEDGSLDDTQWQAFIDRLHREGVLTAKDWTFVQAVWDLMETTKEGAQRAHRQVYGRYFDEIAADPVDTPFGQLRGGYVPALTDSNLVQDAALRSEQEAVEGGDSAMFPAASNGFTKSRVEDYTRELALDLRLLSSHIDKVLKFTHLGPPVRDVARILKDRGFSAMLQAKDPTAQTDLLLPWLQRAAKQIVETPSKGRAGKAGDRFFSAVRSRVGMQLMFANVVNTAQQIIAPQVFLRVKPSRIAEALWTYVRDPVRVADTASSQSVFLANRMATDIFEARQAINQLTKLNPSKKDEVVDFLTRHAYFMQSAVQNVMDVVSWTAAYNQATEQGQDAREAQRFADSVIRETQGSMAPEDVSRFETGTPFVRMFTQFAGYFNMMANLDATEVQLVARGVGLKKGAGRLFYIYLMGFAIPALLGDAVAKALRGGWEDEDGDGYMDDMLAWFFATQAKFAFAAVPVVGQTGNALIGTTTGQPYDDRLSISPAVSVIESTVKVPKEVYDTITKGESFNRTDVRDTLNLLGLMTGTPAGALAKPAGYATSVAQGDTQPTGPLDAARGAITGAPSPKSKVE